MCNLPRLLLAVMPCVAGLTLAQEFPAKAIRYVVLSAPGGSSDTLARVMAPRLGELLGPQMLIDGRAGASGVIGAEIVVRASADGHTLLQAATSHATNPAKGVKLPYDLLRDFAPIALLS
jgi:tripartite-type tricarboxylate transporter receptor subunit TctC